MRSFTRDHAPPGGALHKPASIDPDVAVRMALDHNVGACNGCGGSRIGVSGGCCSVCGPGGGAMTGGGASAARMFFKLWPDAGALLASINTGIGARGNDGMVSGAEVVRSVSDHDTPCTPYMDAVRDCLCMVELPSQRVAAVAGTVTLLTIQPQSGWFFGFYFDINVNRPGTPPANPCVPPCEYQIERPTVRGCPTSPCIPPAVPAVAGSTSIPMAGNFLQAPQTCSGCGRPFVTVIPNLSNGTPLEVRLFGLATGDIAQAIVRGFCFDTRICC